MLVFGSGIAAILSQLATELQVIRLADDKRILLIQNPLLTA
jgi:hypothetical protein